MKIHGIHHISAVSANAQKTVDFYAGLLGLRFIKQTVNFDDPYTYHLYFADYPGSPGTVLTFFPWQDIRRGRHGTSQVSVTSFSVPNGSIGYWKEHLSRAKVITGSPEQLPYGESLTFFDPDGLQLALVDDGSFPELPEHAFSAMHEDNSIIGFHSATLFVSNPEPTLRLLIDAMGYIPAENGTDAFVLRTEPGIGSKVIIAPGPSIERGMGGAGTIHHIAWRVNSTEEEERWRDILIARGLQPTEIINRKYFHSVYFREPGGILFELATDGPGFTVDEEVEALGSSLRLPPWYESQRSSIERILPPLKIPLPTKKTL